MHQLDNLVRTQNLLAQALAACQKTDSSDRTLSEAKVYMRQALVRLENATKKELRRKKNASAAAHQNLWPNAYPNLPMAGYPQLPMAKEAAVKTLKDLDELIAKQKASLDGLEQKVQDEVQGKVIND